MDELKTPESNLNELATALAAFQAECPTFEFDKTVKSKKYSFKYVTLGQLIAKTKPLLAKHGLSVAQLPWIATDPTNVAVKTLVLHKSGQVMSSLFEMKIPVIASRDANVKPDPTPQDVGSGLSYARRYAYASFLGLITDEDTDGHSPDEIYSSSPADKKWLMETCQKLGITDNAVMGELHKKLIAQQSVKSAKLVQQLID